MRTYYSKPNAFIYFLNENEEGKWVNKLKKIRSTPLNDPESELMVVLLYKTDHLSWGEKNFNARDRGGIYVFRSFSKKEVQHKDLFGVYADEIFYLEDDGYKIKGCDTKHLQLLSGNEKSN